MTVGELKKELDDYGDHNDVVLRFDDILIEKFSIEWDDVSGNVVLES